MNRSEASVFCIYSVYNIKFFIETNSQTAFLNILDDFGGWPVLVGEKWNDLTFDWKQTMYKLRKEGYSFNYLIGFEITPDYDDFNKRIIHVSFPLH